MSVYFVVFFMFFIVVYSAAVNVLVTHILGNVYFSWTTVSLSLSPVCPVPNFTLLKLCCY